MILPALTRGGYTSLRQQKVGQPPDRVVEIGIQIEI
jgi:hypothetical protein